MVFLKKISDTLFFRCVKTVVVSLLSFFGMSCTQSSSQVWLRPVVVGDIDGRPFPPLSSSPGARIGGGGGGGGGGQRRGCRQGLLLAEHPQGPANIFLIFFVMGKRIFTTHRFAPEVDGGIVFDLNFDLSLTSLGLLEAAPAPAPCGLAE